MTAEWRAVRQSVRALFVLVLVSTIVLALAWLGATGEVPWGYKADDHWPIWRQYICLSVVALGTTVVVVAMWRADARGVIRPRASRAVGASLALITFLWGTALFTFGLWGGDPGRALAVGAASVAPASSVSLALVWLGFSGQRVGAVLICCGVLSAGVVATLLAFE